MALRRPEPAARLCGASDGLRDLLRDTVPPVEQEAHRRLRASLRERLTENDYAREVAAGREMLREEAVIYVRQVLEEM